MPGPPLLDNPHHVETKIEAFLDNFKYVQSACSVNDIASFDQGFDINQSSLRLQPVSIMDSSYSSAFSTGTSVEPKSPSSVSCFGIGVTTPSSEKSLPTPCSVTSMELEGQNEGGKASNGAPILTFPDLEEPPDMTDEEYRDLVTYLASVPPLEEVNLGFVIVIDRRKDKWGSVKHLLLRISGYFPGLVQEVYILRPTGLIQRTFSDVGFKFVRDDFKFKVLMCSSVEELQEHLPASQLTSDLGGSLCYNHEEWVQHRAAIEKFSANTSQIGESLSVLCKRLQETEFPNDVASTVRLINDHQAARSQVREDLTNTIHHGQILRSCVKTTRDDDGKEIELETEDLPANKLSHVANIDRLLIQLEETAKNFDDFWLHHEKKLLQCLQLRKFEECFKELVQKLEAHIDALNEMTELGDSADGTDKLISNLEEFEEANKSDMEGSNELHASGEQFIEDDHYAVDCIRPKCIELQRICEQYKELLRRRHELLNKSRELHTRLRQVSDWCDQGEQMLELLSSTDWSNSPQPPGKALNQLDEFTARKNQLKLSSAEELTLTYESVMSPELKLRIEETFQRIEEVKSQCLKQRQTLKTLSNKPSPSHTQPPANHITDGNTSDGVEMRQSKTPDKTHESRSSHHRSHKKSTADSSDSDSPSFLGDDPESTARRRKHAVRELIETERSYVAELKEILEGYAWQMDSVNLKHLVPKELVTKKRVLFGNMEEIYEFHANVFLKELESCKNSPALVGKCFADRKEEFEMYTYYCQNKPASENLRKEIGDNNQFFKECQKRLDHKLPLGAYLLKPVQRITKYQLLIKEMLKYTQQEGGSEAGCQELQDALDAMLSLLKYVNDIMHQIAITGYEGNLADLGKLHMQGSFSVWPAGKKNKDLRFKAMQRHIFLYENMIVFCKKKDEPTNAEKASYIYKNSLQTSQIGITENHKGEKRKFEVWLHNHTEAYIILAPSVEVKASWINAAKQILHRQFEKIKASAKREIPTVPIMSTEHSPSPPPGSPLLVPPSPSPSNTSTSSSESKSVANNNNLQGNKQEAVANEDIIVPKSSSSAMAALPRELVLRGMEGRRFTDDEEVGWTSDEPEDDVISISQEPFVSESAMLELQCQHYLALAEYIAMDTGELSISEGDILEVVKIGSEGWWFVKNVHTGAEGWTPASYLELNKRASTYSNLSTLSSGSTDSGGGGFGVGGVISLSSAHAISGSSPFPSRPASVHSSSSSNSISTNNSSNKKRSETYV